MCVSHTRRKFYDVTSRVAIRVLPIALRATNSDMSNGKPKILYLQHLYLFTLWQYVGNEVWIHLSAKHGERVIPPKTLNMQASYIAFSKYLALFSPHRCCNSFFFSDSPCIKLYTSIWDTRANGIPQTRQSLSIAEQGILAEDTVEAHNDISWYAVVFNFYIPKKSIQA